MTKSKMERTANKEDNENKKQALKKDQNELKELEASPRSYCLLL